MINKTDIRYLLEIDLDEFYLYPPDKKHNIISSLDPLNADLYLMELPHLNHVGDVSKIIDVTKILLPDSLDLEGFSVNEACAAVRDLGILAGSIKRYGLEPVEAIPDIESVFVRLGKKTDMVPRDTLIHYTLWNPDNERKRRYTLHIDETRMIESAKMAIPKLETAIYQLINLHTIPFDSSDFITECQRCRTSLNGMVEAIVYTIKNVSRKVFAQDLRPFFDSFTINSQEYLGPGAVEMPLFIFDHFLWSSRYEDEKYLKFKQGFIPYCLPHLRNLYYKFEHELSLLDKLIKILESSNFSPLVRGKLVSAASEIIKIMQILIKFRKPHIKVVDQAYLHAENRQREKGSGGYQEDTLNYLTYLTESAIGKLEKYIY